MRMLNYRGVEPRRMLTLFAAALALGVLVVALGSNSSKASDTTAKASAKSIPYTGPEKGLPTGYAKPKIVKGKKCTIGFQNIYAAIPPLAASQAAAKAEATSLGCKFIALDDQLTPTKQVDNFNQLLSQHVSAIIVYPIVPTAMAPSISKATAAKIPVLANATPPAASDPLPKGYKSRVLQGEDLTAYLRVKYIAQQNPGAKYATLGLAIPVASLQYLTKRTKYWAGKFGLKFAGQVDAQEDTPAGASTAMSALLGKYSDLKVVFPYNDNAAIAASTVVRSSGANVKICGSNGQKSVFEAIKKGRIACTVLVDWKAIGRQLVRGAYTTITSPGTKLPATVSPISKLVTKSNVGSLKSVG